MRSILVVLMFVSFNAISQTAFNPLGLGQPGAYFTDSMGIPAGSAQTIGSVTAFTDARGIPAGTAQRIGDSVYFTDSRGIPAGSAQAIRGTTYFTGADGIPAGSASTFGSSSLPR